MNTKAEAKRLAKEFQTRYVYFYGWGERLEVSIDDKDVVIKSLEKGVFHQIDCVCTFLNGMRVSWYVSVDDEGYLYIRAF